MRDEIPIELTEQIEKGNCVLFVGAGLSAEAGLPTWRELMAPLCRELEYRRDTDPLFVAQVYGALHGRQRLLERVRDATDTTGKAVPPSLLSLVQMGFETWITTNYDNLIEKAMDQSGKEITRVVWDRELSSNSSGKPMLIKLHGDREYGESVIITEEDYAQLWRKRTGVREEVQTLLRKKTFLFVGYGLGDPDFNLIRSLIRLDLGKYAWRHFGVFVGVDDPKRQYLRSMGIEAIDTESLTAFVTRLTNALHLATYPPRREYYFDNDANLPDGLLQFLTNKGILSRFKERRRRIVKCEEYLIHSIAEQGQYNDARPGWKHAVRRRLGLSPDAIEEYDDRRDNEGNVWHGFAIGV